MYQPVMFLRHAPCQKLVEDCFIYMLHSQVLTLRLTAERGPSLDPETYGDREGFANKKQITYN